MQDVVMFSCSELARLKLSQLFSQLLDFLQPHFVGTGFVMYDSTSFL
jgi:hypothetical protein